MLLLLFLPHIPNILIRNMSREVVFMSIFVSSRIGFAVNCICGVLLHFAYALSGKNKAVAVLSAVNESTWEHMKLLFVPAFLYSLVQYFFFKNIDDYLCVRLRSIAIGLLLIPVLFYTYNGVIGKSPGWVNIGVFIVSCAVMYIYEAKVFATARICDNAFCSHACFCVLCILAVLFVIFTFAPPHIGIFKDPVTGGYGVGA